MTISATSLQVALELISDFHPPTILPNGQINLDAPIIQQRLTIAAQEFSVALAEQAAVERAAVERAAVEQAESEQDAAERLVAERAEAEEFAATEKLAAEVNSAEVVSAWGE